MSMIDFLLILIAVLLALLVVGLVALILIVRGESPLLRSVLQNALRDILGDVLPFFDNLYRERQYRFDDYPRRSSYDRELVEIIERTERRIGIQLTWAAREMLMIPIIEQIQGGYAVNMGDVENSVLTILETIDVERSDQLRSRRGAWNALAIIKGFYWRFCNIPPFCVPTEDSDRGDRR